MNLSQLRYFRKLAQVQHFTRAAEELFITQPALSNSIKQFEIRTDHDVGTTRSQRSTYEIRQGIQRIRV